MSDSDSDSLTDSDSNDYPLTDEEMKVEIEDPPGVTGLALAEHYFGPLLSPVAATPAQWEAYTKNRRATNARHGNMLDDRKSRSIRNTVACMEGELGLEEGTLQKCVSVLWRIIEWDDDEVSGICSPRPSDNLVGLITVLLVAPRCGGQHSDLLPGCSQVHRRAYQVPLSSWGVRR
ncbi:hypothetical protein L210DRAFT_2268758 [Boletus edulis BED1]|uniref:Uncharacterized protein n=1 Tax=Boletus edulis BED1 TaxID=1328754 RepID=A0AAD4BRQ1_BOLED|nr:hypothetical protein L210DRAFT_2268758 [Boletus edulis BED1]